MLPLKTLNYYRKFSLGLIFILITACSSNYQAPVGEVGEVSSASSRDLSTGRLGREHRVNSGETLYAIAFQYDLDYSALALANGISSPYVIFPGQTLTLNVSRSSVGTQTSPRESSSQVSSNSRPSNTNAASVPVRTTSITVENAALRWSWPASGRIIGSFSNTGIENKGIDIAGKEGDAVFAAEAGEVVYSGSGLLRYGDLLIIKHNEQFLSAYAHNSQLLVTLGDKVTKGQRVAALGSTGIDREMLHFEIRRNGNPVDPIGLLPSR